MAKKQSDPLTGLLPACEATVAMATKNVGDLYLRMAHATCSSIATFDCVGDVQEWSEDHCLGLVLR